MKKRVLITGGSRGIGKTIAEQYAREGFEVIAPKRSELDLSSLDSVKGYLAQPQATQVDVLINNAGENKIGPIDETPLQDWLRILNVNLNSVFLLTQGIAPKMAQKGWGRIVNISSIYSFLARSGRAPYSASKSALNGLTRSTALEYGPQGVLTNAVCPGFVETEMTHQNNTPAQIKSLCEQVALKRLGQPQEIARFVYFLGSEQNTFITGQTLTIDGGFSIQ